MAYATEADYDWTTVSGGVKITKYKGNEKEIAIPERLDGRPVRTIGNNAFKETNLTSVMIPDSVTKIESAAFSDNDLTKVIISRNVTDIAANAFVNNQATPADLTIIGQQGSAAETYANNHTHTFEAIAMFGTEGDYEWELNLDWDLDTVRITKYTGQNKEVVIPATIDGKAVTVIAYAGSGAFGSKGLTSVKIPEGVKEIGQWAFGTNELNDCKYF